MLVRYYGHVGIPTGYGVAGGHLCRALLAAGAEVEIRPLSPFPDDAFTTPGLLPLTTRVRTDATLSPNCDAIIVHTLPYDCATVADSLPMAISATMRPLIAYTTWEGVEAPADLLGMLSRRFSQVWTPSRASANALEGVDGRIVASGFCNVIPHPYDDQQPRITRRSSSEPSFCFLWYGEWNARKNPLGLVRAFASEFTPADRANLHLHSRNMTAANAQVALGQTGIEQAQLPMITFSNGHKELRDLLKGCDCFVTAARGEAWNLPAFEAAVLAGAQVIAPTDHGSDDFLRHDTTAWLYPSQISPAWRDVRITDAGVESTGPQGLTSKTTWREPDLFALAAAMRNIYAERDRDIKLRYNPVERYGYKAVGELMLRTIEQGRRK